LRKGIEIFNNVCDKYLDLDEKLDINENIVNNINEIIVNNEIDEIYKNSNYNIIAKILLIILKSSLNIEYIIKSDFVKQINNILIENYLLTDYYNIE